MWGKKKQKTAASMIMSVNMLDLLSHIYPEWTGGQNDWPSPTWLRLSPGICWSVIEQDTECPPAPGCCSAAQLALWPHPVREGALPFGIKTGLCYLAEDANCSFVIWHISLLLVGVISMHLRSKRHRKPFARKHQHKPDNKWEWIYFCKNLILDCVRK